MKKLEMLEEIVNSVNWNNTSKKNHVKSGLKKNKEMVEKIYTAFLNDKENAIFYANLL